MKRLVTSILIILAVFYLGNISVYSQNSETPPEIKVFGLGLHIEQFRLSDLNTNTSVAPVNKLIFTVTSKNRFRYEPEIGFSFQRDKDNDLSSKTIHIGLGVYGMTQKGRTNIYGGVKFEYANISSDYIDWFSDEKETMKVDRFSIGPTIGAEYFLGDHFSIGGEISLIYRDLKTKNSQYSFEIEKSDYISIETGLLLRFYF
ncbi:MAG: hypothetical protein CVT98_06470 [Bacteroidetes bacterium HGW-Bacteroidetes-15]|nr:MAG: hypothetical protein CVT98_06470 [Bacteroidetes bacterium HGW-Bacteroidetes-15]